MGGQVRGQGESEDDVSERKELGKIRSVRFGFGGYQDGEVGLFLEFGGNAWGVSASISGGWSTTIKHSKSCRWTEEDRTNQYANMCREIQEVLKKAKVNAVHELQGKPVEVTFDGMTLKSWRVLDEVL